MKKIIVVILLLVGSARVVSAQKNIYTTTGGEWIFSAASAKQQGFDVNSIIRFSPVINLQSQLHYDMSKTAGLFTGLSLRNVGFIWDDPIVASTKHKARAYTLGVPFGIKIGNMDGFFLFGGYELELPVVYKEKLFVNEKKQSKDSYWFSNRIPSFYNSLFVGVQGPQGMQLKFKYYLTNFFNKSYAANDGQGNLVYPYQNFDANVFYFSVSFQILKGTKFYYAKADAK